MTARAVASLAELSELALPLLMPGGVLVAWKGSVVADTGRGNEIDAARRALDEIDPGARIEVVRALPGTEPAGADRPLLADLAGHRLVVVERGRGPIADHWPRDPATRRRHPW